MGSLKDAWLEEQSEEVARNRYNREVQRIKKTMRLYESSCRPSFTAKLQQELSELQLRRKEHLASRRRVKR